MASVNMNFIFILSVILKGIGAVLEIALQILLTKLIGLSGYGSYSTWISGADLLFWVFFSGLIKCNTYYLSRGSASLSHFKKLYYIRYMLPLAAGFGLFLILLKRPAFCIILAITIAETFIMDQSSTLLARELSHISYRRIHPWQIIFTARSLFPWFHRSSGSLENNCPVSGSVCTCLLFLLVPFNEMRRKKQ